MTIFWLKCRAGWKESFEEIRATKDGSKLIINFGGENKNGSKEETGSKEEPGEEGSS